MSDPLALPLALEAKRLSPGHVVMGKQVLQVSFLQEILGGTGVEVSEQAHVDDMTLLDRLGRPGSFIWIVPNAKALNVAEDVRRRINVWAMLPIRKRTAAIRALVRVAVEALGLKDVTPERIDAVGERVIDQLGEEAPPSSLIWAAAWHLTGAEDSPEKEKYWANPWDKPWSWCPKGVTMPHRLNTLYKLLVAWTFARDDNKSGAEGLGVSPAAYRWLQSERIAPARVDAAICVLSAWRLRQDDGYAVALRIGSIFAK